MSDDIVLGAIGSRQLPELTSLNRPFWTGGADGRLLIQRCGHCQRWQHPPRPRCVACGSIGIAPAPVSGRASLYSFVVNRHPWRPNLQLPYVIGLVELAEQRDLRLTTNVIGCRLSDVQIGMALDVTFEAQGECFVPLFRPATG